MRSFLTDCAMLDICFHRFFLLVVSAGSEVFVNGQLDLSTKSAMHSGMDDGDMDDGSDGSDDDDIDSKSGK